MIRLFMALLALVASPVSVLAEEPKVCGAPVALNDGWTVATQAEVGLDAAKLCELDSFIAQWPEANIHAVVVVRSGKLAMERYFSGEDERWGDKLGRVTYGPELKHEADPFRYILAQPVAYPAGTVYAYSGGGTSLLGETLVRSTGRSLRDYARDKLFAPLDVPDFEWLDAGVSRKLGAFGSLRLRPRDAAKLGRLLLTDGQWNGKQVLPPGWAADSVKPRIKGEGLYFYG